MKFDEFQSLLSVKRIQRYETAMQGNTRKAMILYRYNLQLSQELFILISIFEIILRNKIDGQIGVNDWLCDASLTSGAFDLSNSHKTKRTIQGAYNSLRFYFSLINKMRYWLHLVGILPIFLFFPLDLCFRKKIHRAQSEVSLKENTFKIN
ncbi:hypothetical protein QDY71_05465 [Kingella negevensis]|uniref:Abi-like protein n=1 Tax=Kingella negevensis TaxID=1522312 RepID=A0A238TFX1_9NEIS|nr:hypothetical protein [Kingella negevensis]MDK4679367.1 hypothetical protein [Kingella negevensis]MDK4682913.1 hypothetical protein [Kingella negevensis]MDK4685641.1 hypothetical protein [Kingella negevensis]MDK4691112.1 hypothetical protein [Kingella negevensis]MDK4693741.1 hypothetical protein [Kingella negevensis]